MVKENRAEAMALAGDAGSEQAAPEAKVSKSIVPAKYAGKYKSGGSDALAEFIKSQCVNKEGTFEFPAFFELCKINGIEPGKVDHYSGLVQQKAHGAEGRARMTLRNMLATPARKTGKLKNLAGEEVEVSVPAAILPPRKEKAAA